MNGLFELSNGIFLILFPPRQFAIKIEAEIVIESRPELDLGHGRDIGLQTHVRLHLVGCDQTIDALVVDTEGTVDAFDHARAHPKLPPILVGDLVDAHGPGHEHQDLGHQTKMDLSIVVLVVAETLIIDDVAVVCF